MIVRRFDCICFFILMSLLFIEHSEQFECLHPSNYSDFTLVLINNTIIATGGNLVKEIRKI